MTRRGNVPWPNTVDAVAIVIGQQRTYVVQRIHKSTYIAKGLPRPTLGTISLAPTHPGPVLTAEVDPWVQSRRL